MDQKDQVFCTFCGKPISASAKFCPWCGGVCRSLPQVSERPASSSEPSGSVEQPGPTGSVTEQLTSGVQAPTPPPVQPSAVPPASAPPVPPQKGKEKKKGNPVLWILVLLVIAAAVAASVIGFQHYQQEKEYKLQLETGLRYLEDGDYREAILAFNAAIEINPKSAEAYAGRGDANMGLEKYRAAAEDYLHALELSDENPEIYLNLASAYMEMGRREDAIEILEKGEKATQDERIIQWLELLLHTNGTGTLSGMVSEYLPQGGTAPLPGAQVRLYRSIEDVRRLIYQGSTNSTGNFSLTGLAEGTYQLHVEADGHLGIVTEEEIAKGEENYTELFLLIPESETIIREKAGTFTAQVTNAIKGEGVANAEVTLRAGWNNRKGRAAAQATTDMDGSFTLNDLPYGYYTAETSANDFISAYHNVAVLPEDYTAQWDLPMSPMLTAGETRIVLTWGERPYDLDSHLVGTDFHVFYSNRDFYDNLGRHRVNLDLDDTSSYGPETTTIYQGVDGVYTYSVYDYSNGSQTNSTALSTSGATVRVYQENGLTATYHVPTGQVGTTWAVFRIHANGQIVPINTVSNIYPTH